MSGGSDIARSLPAAADRSVPLPPSPPLPPPLPPVLLLELLPQPATSSVMTLRIVNVRFIEPPFGARVQSKRRAVVASARARRRARQLSSLLADRQIAHGRRRAWDASLRCEMPRRRGECRRGGRLRTNVSTVDSRAFVSYPPGMSLPLHRPQPKALKRDQ